ncbi:hypothetical protein ACFXPS_33385 [Nocardia sp. NPDC059091]|uniref:hypothetical protein n=1 Tax=unclassified Nocardia TaxID=2637762 RepID=UPI0036A4AC63
MYDVPQDWTVPTPTTIVGFEGGGGRVVMSGAAELSPKACDGHHSKAIAGVTGPKLGDVSAAAKDVAGSWATVAGANDDRPNSTYTLSTVETLTVQGKPAAHVTATLANPGPNDCSHPAASIVHAVAVPGRSWSSTPTRARTARPPTTPSGRCSTPSALPDSTPQPVNRTTTSSAPGAAETQSGSALVRPGNGVAETK